MNRKDLTCFIFIILFLLIVYGIPFICLRYSAMDTNAIFHYSIAMSLLLVFTCATLICFSKTVNKYLDSILYFRSDRTGATPTGINMQLTLPEEYSNDVYSLQVFDNQPIGLPIYEPGPSRRPEGIASTLV